ncbi:hypothetical protein Tco_0174492 [Tanacetum coccineum]
MNKAHDRRSKAFVYNFVEKFLGTVHFGNDQFARLFLVLWRSDFMGMSMIKGFITSKASITIFPTETILLNGSREDLMSLTQYLFKKQLINSICFLAKASPIKMVMASTSSHLTFDLITLLTTERVGRLTQVEICRDQLLVRASDMRQNVVPSAEKPDSSHQGLEFLFSPLLEEYYNPTHDQAEENNNDQAPNDPFQKSSLETSSWKSNHASSNKTKLATDPKWVCSHSGSIVEPKNIRRQMADSAWIELECRMKLHQFDRLNEATQVFYNYQVDVEKTAFLNGLTEGRGLRCSADGFIDPDHPEKSTFKEMLCMD